MKNATPKIDAPQTYGEALAQGWTETDSAWCRGYVSRKTNPDNATIQVGGGSRKGEYYVVLPSWRSSRYCVRQYLRPQS